MGLPYILKNMNMFLNGAGYVGQIAEVTLPPLVRKMEGYRGGGMDGPVKVDMGLSDDGIVFEWKPGGFLVEAYQGFGAVTHDAEMIRWVGAYQDDGAGLYKTVEVTTRGRHEEITPGTAKPSEKGEETIKTTASYYKLTVDGATVIEIDIMNMVFVVNGTDRNAELRAALGI